MSKINYNKGELAILALYNLGGKGDLEDIAEEVDKIAPGQFRWIKNPEWISDRNVWHALYNVNKHKLGKMVQQINLTYFLTDVGSNFAKDNIDKIDKDLRPVRREKTADRKKRNLALKRIISSTPFKLLENNEQDKITKKDLEFLFKINDYMKEKKKNEKIEQLKSIFNDQKEIRDIIITFEKLLIGKKEKINE